MTWRHRSDKELLRWCWCCLSFNVARTTNCLRPLSERSGSQSHFGVLVWKTGAQKSLKPCLLPKCCLCCPWPGLLGLRYKSVWFHSVTMLSSPNLPPCLLPTFKPDNLISGGPRKNMHLTHPEQVSAAYRRSLHHKAVQDTGDPRNNTLSPPALLFSRAYWRICKEISWCQDLIIKCQQYRHTPELDTESFPLSNPQGEIKVQWLNLPESSSPDILMSKECKVRNKLC